MILPSSPQPMSRIQVAALGWPSRHHRGAVLLIEGSSAAITVRSTVSAHAQADAAEPPSSQTSSGRAHGCFTGNRTKPYEGPATW
jgi:hypothetical protein